MKAFITHLFVQFRGDLRDKGVLLVYYIVPLVFYVVMGSIMKLPEMEMEKNLILSITIFALSMSAFLGLPQILVRARENGILQAFRVAGIPSWSMPLTAIIISFLHMMIVAFIILITAPLIFSVSFPQNIAAHILCIVLVALASQAIGVLLSCFIKKQTTLTLAGQCLFLPTIMLTGIMFPMSLLPKAMRVIGEIFPASQGMKLIKDNAIQITPLIMLFTLAVLAFGLSMIMFRRINMKK